MEKYYKELDSFLKLEGLVPQFEFSPYYQGENKTDEGQFELFFTCKNSGERSGYIIFDTDDFHHYQRNPEDISLIENECEYMGIIFILRESNCK